MNAPSVSALLTQQFYEWERWGRGWSVWPSCVSLEPPFRQFVHHDLPTSTLIDDGSFDTPLSRFADQVRSLFGNGGPRQTITSRAPEIQRPEAVERGAAFVELQVTLPHDYRPLPEIFEQCLFALRYCRSALSFEILADHDHLVAQLVGEQRDAEQVFAQLKSHFPEAVITPETSFLERMWQSTPGCKEVCEFGLANEFVLPLLCLTELATDPLVGLCGALEHLGEDELAVFQVLFQPVRHPWAQSMLAAVTTDDGDDFFENAPEILKEAKKKVARPLFAAVTRAAAKSPEEERVWQVIKSIAGVLSLFDNPCGNRLCALSNDEYPDFEHEEDLLARSTRRLGMILNSEELISLAHLPSAAVASRKLKRETKRTKPAPQIVIGAGVVLGENIHERNVLLVKLQTEQRMRHMHVIGASGTGKSTLLLNLICQDIYQGRGIGVLDPHGDLIEQVMGYIPPERYKDVILLDASDSEYPIGFNILSAHSDLEKTLLASDLVAVFQRLSTSWGDQMTSVLGNAILAFLESTKGGTLADLRRFLIERAYREEFLASVQDPEVVYYWKQQFSLLKTNALGPLLTRLDTFLRPKTVRYMVAQKENKLDFAAIMNKSKILLAKLPQGLIGEENAFLLGALLVSKFHQLAISRQEMQEAERRPFFLFLDEFQHFATPSMATILSGVRKYQLALVLAHHEMAQLQGSPDIASAVLAQPYTRACFRLGTEDARKLAEGFSYFEADDLQNLGTGEAICRVERSDYDFNLRTVPPPAFDEGAAQRRAYIRYLSRREYGTPWQKVEEELAKTRFHRKEEPVDPFTKRMARGRKAESDTPIPGPETPQSPVSEKAAVGPVPDKPKPVDIPPPPKLRTHSEIATLPKPRTPGVTTLPSRSPRPGRGGVEHQDKQQRIKDLAVGLGYILDVEKAIPAGSVDVALKRGNVRIACEISVSTTPRHELDNLHDRFAAGFNLAIMIGRDHDHVCRLKDAGQKLLSPEEERNTIFCCLENVGDVLVDIAAKTPIIETVAHGRRVKVKHDPRTQQSSDAKRTMLDTVAKLIRKRKK